MDVTPRECSGPTCRCSYSSRGRIYKKHLLLVALRGRRGGTCERGPHRGNWFTLFRSGCRRCQRMSYAASVTSKWISFSRSIKGRWKETRVRHSRLGGARVLTLTVQVTLSCKRKWNANMTSDVLCCRSLLGRAAGLRRGDAQVIFQTQKVANTRKTNSV